MARTAPVPNIPAIPGMNPGVWVMGGGAGGGGGSGDGDGGDGDQGADGENGGDGAEGGGNGANDCGGGTGGGCSQCQPGTSAGDPVDVVTGRVFTEPATDVSLPGPLLFLFLRQYNSAACDVDFGLGYGWGFSLGWRIVVRRRNLEVWTGEHRKVEMPVPTGEETTRSRAGWEMKREGDLLVLDVGAETAREFEPVPGASQLYRLRALVDLSGNRITLSYEKERVSVTDSAGRRLSMRLNDDRRITSIVLEPSSKWEGRELARYEHDDEGNLTRYTGPGGAIFRYDYDADHRLTKTVHPSGLTFHFVYDAEGRCTETWGDALEADLGLDPAIPTTLADEKTLAKGIYHAKLDFGPGGYVEVMTSLRLDRFFGNAFGLLDKSVVGGAVSTWTYDAAGNPTRMCDAEENTLQMEWDDRSRLLKVIDPLGRVTELVRDGEGRLVEHIDPAGFTWKYEHDERGLVVAMTTPAKRRFEISRDMRGLITEERLPTGASIQYTYDAEGNLIEIKLPEGGTWRYEYDGMGRRLRTTDPLGRTSQVWRDEAGRVTASQDPAGGLKHLGWDAEGRLVDYADPDGSRLRFGWGHLNRITSLRYENGDTFRQFWNREGDLVAVEAPSGERTTRSYDGLGRPVREEAADGRVTQFTYDKLGRLFKVVRGGETTTYAYDAASQVIEAEYDDGSKEVFTHDERGFVVAVASPRYSIECQYDADRRLASETQTAGGESATVEYSYDALGECAGYVTSSGHSVAFERTGRGLSKAITLDDAVRVDVDRDALGLVRKYKADTGLVVEQAYDDLDRLVSASVLSATGASPAVMSLGYSAAGHLMSRSVSCGGKTQQDGFSYDGKGRLVFAALGAARHAFAYSVTDDLSNVTAGAAARVYGKGGQLRSVGDTALTWDAAGRLSEKRSLKASPGPGASYEWDGRGCLQKVKTEGGLTVEMVHDAGGRRLHKSVRRTSDGAPLYASRFVWDRQRLVHEIRKAEGEGETTTTFYCEGEAAPVPRMVRVGDDWQWVVTHTNGLPAMLVDMRGDAEAPPALDAWGAPLGKDAPALPFRFSGQYYDEETGLAENHFRYYDPSLGMYMAPEPMGALGGWNPFAYCQNPVGWADPLGLMLMRVTTTAPGVDVNDPAPMPYSYNPPTSYNPAPNEWRNYPRESMGGAAGDCEQRIMGHMDPTGTGNPALSGQTVNMHCLGEPGTRMGPLPPCPSCREKLRAFAQRNNCTVNYTMQGGGGVRFLPNGSMQRL